MKLMRIGLMTTEICMKSVVKEVEIPRITKRNSVV
jgi:hypothetical protein